MFSFFSSPKSKLQLRRECRLKRDKLPQSKRQEAAELIDQHIRQFFSFSKSSIIAGYYAGGAELDLLHVIESLRRNDITVSLPVVVRKNAPLQFVIWKDGDSLVKSEIVPVYEPSLLSVAVIPNVIFVPVVGFDRRGNRLGQGGGYYDRTLSALRQHISPTDELIIVGVGYSCQEVKKLTVDETDEKLDYMVTEKEVISFI